jgi:hypothetical protein
VRADNHKRFPANYVGNTADGRYAPFHWNSSISPQDVEISDDVFLILRELAEAYQAGQISPPPKPVVGTPGNGPSESAAVTPAASGEPPVKTNIARLAWSGEVPHQKWMNFYTKVLSKFAATPGLKITLRVEVSPTEGVSAQKVDETKVALRELGLKDALDEE